MARDFSSGNVTVGVLGAGAMGRGIAQVTITGGMTALLYDAADGASAAARDFIFGMLDRNVEKSRMSAEDAAAAKDRLQVVDGLGAMAEADVVIEAIVENLEVKQAVFADLERAVGDDAILASNTSSLRIAAIAAACERRHRVAGLHFFNPVPLMKLVEVVRAPATDEEVVAALDVLGRRMGRVPVVVRDGPGFLVNLGGRAFTTEGLRLAHEGIATPAQIDAVMRDACGFRMGPFELMDLTGIDVNFPASMAIYNGYFQDRRMATYPLHESLLEAGRLGRKTGQGHYRYDDQGGKIADSADADTSAEPARRVALAEANERLAGLLREAGADIVDDDGACPILAAPLGEDATAVAVRTGADARRLVAVDLTGDIGRRLTIMAAPGADPRCRDGVAARLAGTGAAITAIHDSPGFVAQRMRAMVANLGCEIAQIGVAAPADIDTAMTLGLNYPLGPLALTDEMGAGTVLTILTHLQRITGEERYRPSQWLRRRALLGLPATTPD